MECCSLFKTPVEGKEIPTIQTTKVIDLQSVLTGCLGDLLNRQGQILYCGTDTLMPGTFYFLGFNPAKDGTNLPLREVPLDRQSWSAYTHQCWHCGSANCRANGGSCRDCGKGPRLHQKRVVQIMSELDLSPERTFSTNLIFVESITAREICDED